ncbi:DNA-3-methyladenine glycosylase 1-like isoform X2 [Mangifera indica]|uniref:DNA-3-methyladenine glycosylase 1-like isoform X2 n=1 Tax=Mangifera indica TaxID=29780 RepID=UPI001CF9D420|nr:DNA-3-methyladenine glycosylase 1-like isoform X2 [Mangifera indica]
MMKRPSRTSNTADKISQNPTSSSRIPFRPQKIRKLITPAPPNPVDNPVNSPKIVKPLTFDGEIDLALQYLRGTDPLLATLIDTHRPPSFESGRTPFLSLVKSILYQQLAYKAAKSIYDRFLSLLGGEDKVLADAVISISAQRLRELGVSFRKASYIHDLADKYMKGILSDDLILQMDDEMLFKMLTSVKGVGPWSVHMFMMFSLHKPDVLPVSDLGVRKGVQALYGLKELPGALKMEEVCEKWRPYRSVGAWYMWRLMEAKGTSPNGSTGLDGCTDPKCKWIKRDDCQSIREHG